MAEVSGHVDTTQHRGVIAHRRAQHTASTHVEDAGHGVTGTPLGGTRNGQLSRARPHTSRLAPTQQRPPGRPQHPLTPARAQHRGAPARDATRSIRPPACPAPERGTHPRRRRARLRLQRGVVGAAWRGSGGGGTQDGERPRERPRRRSRGASGSGRARAATTGAATATRRALHARASCTHTVPPRAAARARAPRRRGGRQNATRRAHGSGPARGRHAHAARRPCATPHAQRERRAPARPTAAASLASAIPHAPAWPQRARTRPRHGLEDNDELGARDVGSAHGERADELSLRARRFVAHDDPKFERRHLRLPRQLAAHLLLDVDEVLSGVVRTCPHPPPRYLKGKTI